MRVEPSISVNKSVTVPRGNSGIATTIARTDSPAKSGRVATVTVGATIRRKLNITSRAGLVDFAAVHGLVQLGA